MCDLNCYARCTMSENQPGLRERTRRAVQREIAEAAGALFAEHGFEATTVADIAAAVGMSQRSVFRYFGTKEEIILGKVDLGADDLLTALRARPADEPVWTSLHHVFDILVSHEETAELMNRVVFETSQLLAHYLQKLQHMQDAVVAELLNRAIAAGTPYDTDDPTPRAITAAAFGCLVAAQHAWLASGAQSTFAEVLDRAMTTVGPQD